jgi:GNAT superfamily N-acetyltransferase
MRIQAAEIPVSSPQARPLRARDLDALVAIDAVLGSGVRRAYFERRLAAAQRDPESHLQFAVEHEGALAGFMLGRVLEGEFGRSESEVRLEAFGVKAAARGAGLGAALGAAFETEARRRNLAAIRTAAGWREHELLHFFDRAGYRLSQSYVLDCLLSDIPAGSAGEEQPFEVSLLNEADLEGVARVDRRHTGRDRRGYLCRSVREALADSAIRVSLAARIDGGVAGYLMARLDYGDFGRAEPAAIIDTIGVDPMRAREGIGRALLAQLLVNLRGLRVERVETVVAPNNLDLLGFFHAEGMRPAERLSFVKALL